MNVRRHVTSLARANEGSIAIVFALCITGIFGVVALAVDFARAYNVSSKIATALDAAELAGAKMLDGGGTDTQIQHATETFFNAHMAT